MLGASTIAVIGLAALWVGLRGIIAARKIAAENPNIPMVYPAPLPWLHNRKTAATTVFRIGQLYAAAGCLMCAFGGSAWIMVKTNDRLPACAAIASTLLKVPSEAFPLTVKPLSSSKYECVHAMTASGGATWFRIESTSEANPIGEQFNSKVQELERNGMAINPIAGGFQRAVAGMPGDESRTPITLVIEDSRGLHAVEVHPEALERHTLSFILKNLEHPPPNVP